MNHKLLFLLDVDNTLLDNDLIKKNIRSALVQVLGQEEADHFWEHHDSFREREKLVSFPKAIEEYCQEKNAETCDITLGQIFGKINFKAALYPKTTEVLAHLRTIGTTAIFTEGDSIYQKRKVEKSGLASLVDKVYLYRHKLEYLDQILAENPGSQIIVVEDKAHTLEAIHQRIQGAITILLCQGHHARDDRHSQHDYITVVLSGLQSLLDLKKEDFQSPSILKAKAPKAVCAPNR